MDAELGRVRPLLARIDGLLTGEGRAVVAIDGNSGAGKSTLAALLREAYGANLFHMDDFFLPPERKTEERLSRPGGNVDHERFKAEVLDPLGSGRPFAYRRYDCQTGRLTAPVRVRPSRLSIVEGVYSLHPQLRHAYALKVFCQIAPEAQSARILERSGAALHRRFLNEWIPLENRYFEALGIRELCDIILDAE